MKKAEVIHSSWSSKDIIKFRLISNEAPVSIDHEDRIAALYLDFAFKQRPRFKGALSGLRQFLASESPLKKGEKCFLFHLKSSFCSQDI